MNEKTLWSRIVFISAAVVAGVILAITYVPKATSEMHQPPGMIAGSPDMNGDGVVNILDLNIAKAQMAAVNKAYGTPQASKWYDVYTGLACLSVINTEPLPLPEMHSFSVQFAWGLVDGSKRASLCYR